MIDELGLCQGAARIDLAVINGSMNGFEIKSDADRLDRLARQMDAYGRVLDTVTLVTAVRHLDRARAQLPPWWGIVVATPDGDGVALRRRRKSRLNRHVDPEALVRLLWRDETLGLLHQFGLASGMQSKPRSLLWAKLAASLERPVLAEHVRATLKRRAGWRAGW